MFKKIIKQTFLMLLNILCCYSVFNENAISVNNIQDNNTIMAEYANNEDEDEDDNKDNYEDSIAINEEQNDDKNSKQKKAKITA